MLRTRAPLLSIATSRRLACVRRAANVRSEPGSNSPVIKTVSRSGRSRSLRIDPVTSASHRLLKAVGADSSRAHIQQERAERVTPIQFSRAEATSRLRRFSLQGSGSLVSLCHQNYFVAVGCARSAQRITRSAGAALGSDNLAEQLNASRSILTLGVILLTALSLVSPRLYREVHWLDAPSVSCETLSPMPDVLGILLSHGFIVLIVVALVVAGLGLPIPEDIMLWQLVCSCSAAMSPTSRPC